jgi:hypothetical protein
VRPSLIESARLNSVDNGIFRAFMRNLVSAVTAIQCNGRQRYRFPITQASSLNPDCQFGIILIEILNRCVDAVDCVQS